MSSPLTSSNSIHLPVLTHVPNYTYRSHTNVYHEQQNQQYQNSAFRPQSNRFSSPQSDDQQKTIDHQTSTSPLSLQYLLNQNKMKQIALNKATHLIDLLKLQLEVQRNSQQQSIQIIQQQIKHKYQSIIKQLQIKNNMLERKLQQQKRKYYQLKQQINNNHKNKNKDNYNDNNKNNSNNNKNQNNMLNNHINTNNNRDKLYNHLNSQKIGSKQILQKSVNNLLSDSRAPRLSKTNSSKQFAPSSSRKNTHSTTKRPMSRNNSTMLQREQLLQYNLQQEQLFRVQKAFILKYLLSEEEKDEKLIQELKKVIQINQYQQDNQQYKFNINISSFSNKNSHKITLHLKSYQKQIDQILIKNNKKQKQYEQKLKNYQDINKIQQLIIIQSNQQIQQYDETLKITFKMVCELIGNIFKQDNQIEIMSFNENNAHINSNNAYNNRYNNSFPLTLTQLSQPFSHQNFTINTQSFLSSFPYKSSPGQIAQKISDSIQKSQQSLKLHIRKHKNFLKQKLINMQNENKQLKRILDDMIRLIKTNKRINIGGITNSMIIKQ